MNKSIVSPELAREAQALVLLAFRNGPIERIHAGKRCPTCSGNDEYSRITDEEMKEIMKFAVDSVYRLSLLKERAPEEYSREIERAREFVVRWDDPNVSDYPSKA
jgi:hypothetical protein